MPNNHPTDSPFLTATRLAARLGKTGGYVSAMRAAGYSFLYGATTTEEHARAWIKQTGFTPTEYFRSFRRRTKQKIAA